MTLLAPLEAFVALVALVSPALLLVFVSQSSSPPLSLSLLSSSSPPHTRSPTDAVDLVLHVSHALMAGLLCPFYALLPSPFPPSPPFSLCLPFVWPLSP